MKELFPFYIPRQGYCREVTPFVIFTELGRTFMPYAGGDKIPAFVIVIHSCKKSYELILVLIRSLISFPFSFKALPNPILLYE